MSTIIRTRSPYFIRTAQVSDADLNYFELTITINSGVLNVAQCPTNLGSITLQKKILPTETSVTFELSEVINDFIEQSFNGTYSQSTTNQSLWVNTNITARKADGTAIGSATLASYLAQEGYNTFKEGVNYVTEPEAMITADYVQKKRDLPLYIPVNKERVNSVKFRNGSSVISTTTITDNGNANQKIQYASESNSSINNALITYDTEYERTITIEQVEECKFLPFKCTFLNRWGALQDIFFFKKSTETLDSRNESFNKSIFSARTASYGIPIGGTDCTASYSYNSYSTTDHPTKVFNANARESVTLNTGFVNEGMNESFKELMVSEHIWLTNNAGIVFPATLKDSSFTTKTSRNDRMINYTMNFEMAFDLVNNIR